MNAKSGISNLPVLTGEGGLSLYLTQIKKFPMLDAEEEYMLAKNWSERWIRALIDVDLNDSSSKQLSESQYLESLKFRLGNKIEEEFDEILKGMNFKY